KGIPVKRETHTVSDEDMNKALEALRQPQAKYETVDRPGQTGDVLVVNYTGTTEGKPLTEIAPTAKGLTEQKGFWVELGGNAFLPGFSEQLMGAKAGEKKTVNVDFPADFVTPALGGKRATYEVEVAEVKQKILPVLDDAFAKGYGAENLEGLQA